MLSSLLWRVCLLFLIAPYFLREKLGVQASTTPQDEVSVLYDIYTSTAGEFWDWKPEGDAGKVWNFTTSTVNPCGDHWQGITCSLAPLTQESHIVSISLPSYNLDGTLPLSVGNLTKLRTLELSDNMLKGPIPATIGVGLSELTSLALSNNQLNGTIPASFGQLTSLTLLDLGRNKLQGTLPVELFNLTNLLALTATDNQLRGTLPEAIAGLVELTILEIAFNQLTGRLPVAIGQLVNLHALELRRNRLSGRISSALGQLTQLQMLDLSRNAFTGPVPAFLGGMTGLTALQLHFNRLTGTIPAELGSLSNLRELTLHKNRLEGSIPTSLAQLSGLLILDLDTNKLTGTISEAALGPLTALSVLQLFNNKFTGTIPDFLGAMPSLSVLDLSHNPLQGSLPESLAGLAQLKTFSVVANWLTGPIPSYVCTAFPQLTLFYLTANRFTGTLPECLGNVESLQFFATDHNDLTGTIPDSILALPGLQVLWINNNQFSGPLPDLSAAQNLSQLLLSSNYLTGTLPDYVLGSADTLTVLGMGYNLLTGTLPAAMGELPKVYLWSVNDNHLHGCVPDTLSHLRDAFEVFLQNNRLGCNLYSAFSAATQLSLSYVDVGGNQFTGTLPNELFKLTKLNAFVAVSNCFEGQLTEQICTNHRLVSLILDGLHTSPSCRRDLLPSANSYQVPKAFYGTIPPCLFAMTALASLHVSGNGLTGTLPATAVSPRLTDFIASHNVLTGTVPTAVQQHNWRTLDLSFNKLSGELESSFGAALQATSVDMGTVIYNSTYNNVYLKNNRLSGRVPAPLRQLQNVSVLGSNMFDCELDKSDLPQGDEDYDTYQCGSTAFNAPFYAVLILTGLVFVTVAYVAWRWRQSRTLGKVVKAVQTWRALPEGTPRSLTDVVTLIDVICRIAMWCTALIVVVLVPWYAAASGLYGTYTDQYAWAVSAAFLSGVTPITVEFVLFCALVVALVASTVLVVQTKDQASRLRSQQSEGDPGLSRSATLNSERDASETDTAEPVRVPRWKRYTVYAAFMTVNLVVVVGMNVAFVYIVLSQSNTAVFLSQLLLSLFKLLWSTVCTPFLVYIVAAFISGSSSSDSFLTVQVLIGLFNNLAIPCLVVGVLSPSCFYNVFHAADPVLATFFVENCVINPDRHGCTFVLSKPIVSSYDPPYHYTYQCSSSFITYYAPAFVYLGLAAAVGTPIVKLVGLYFYERSVPGTLWFKVLKRVVPRIIRPIRRERVKSHRAGSGRTLKLSAVYTIAQTVALLWNHYRPLLDANNLIVSLITYLGILLTFGAMFPPLAVVMCLTILSVAWQNKLALGRYLQIVREVGATELIETMERECRGTVSLVRLRRSLFAVICVSCMFYALFLFDTLGDAVGGWDAYWVLIVMPLFPLVFLVAFAVRRRYQPVEDYGVSVGGVKSFELATFSGPMRGEEGGAPDVTSRGAEESGDAVEMTTINELHAADGAAVWPHP